MKQVLFIFLSVFISLSMLSCGEEDSKSNTNPCSDDPCAGSLVPHKTVCVVHGDDFSCTCKAGYEETAGGSCREVEVDPCNPSPCTEEGKGSCTSTGTKIDDYICSCSPGYYTEGDKCIKEINPCEPNPCTETYKTNCFAQSMTPNDFICKCDSGYSENQEGVCVEINDYNLRLIAANITSGNDQSYDWGEGIRIFQALKGDVIMIQELNYKNNSNSDYEELAGKVFNDPNCVDEGRCYYYAGSGQIPNGILSKYPIMSRGYWDDPEIGNRDLNYATIDLPGNKDLFAVSVHLSTKGSKQTRPASIIAERVTEHKSANPNKFYYTVGGDFNGTTAVSTSGFGKNNAFNINAPYPVSEDGGYGTNASRSKHYDWILESHDLTALQTASKFCAENAPTDCKVYNKGLVMDTREYTQTEINKYFSPARLGDSGAINMQHMAIVKDFKIVVE